MLASSVIRDAHRAGIGFEMIVPVGSLRRFSPDVGDITLLGVAPAAQHKRILKSFARLPVAAAASADTAPCSRRRSPETPSCSSLTESAYATTPPR